MTRRPPISTRTYPPFPSTTLFRSDMLLRAETTWRSFGDFRLKRFYFTGQRTFENRGCEAIVRSTVMMLNAVIGPCEILVPSDAIARDSRQWPYAERFDVRFVRAYVPPYTPSWTHLQRIPPGLFPCSGCPFPF